MNLTRNQFTEYCIDLCQALERIKKKSDQPNSLTKWKLCHDTVNNVRDVYLVHPPVRTEVSLGLQLEGDVDEEEIVSEFDLLEDPDAIISPDLSDNQLEWRFSVVYSDTFRVPVLYFQVMRLDGSPCLRNEVLSTLKCNEPNDGWDFLSFEEHPVNGTPSFFLHPCQTSARLSLVYDGKDTRTSPLLSWMTMMLPAVGFRIPVGIFRSLT